MDRPLIDYLPNILKTIAEFRQTMDAEQPELEIFWGECDRFINNCFVLSQDKDAASRWEKILNIPIKDTDELDTRNLRILTVMQGRLPYTYRTLYENLLSIVKSDRDFKLDVDIDKYAVEIVIALSSSESKVEIEAMADRIVPANMTLKVSLWYTTHRMLEKKTHGDLEPYTHEQLTELDLR